MRKLRLLPIVCLTFVFLFSSCVSKKKWTELMNDKEQLDMMLSQTQEQVKSLENDVVTLGDEKTELQEEFNSETSRLNDAISGIQTDLEAAKTKANEMEAMVEGKDAEISKLSAAVKSPFSPYTAKGLQLTEKGGGLYANSPVRFKSGSARLTKDSKAGLQIIVDVLMSDPTAQMIVEGHTDDVPMKEGAPYASNKQLSKARANAVVKTLVKMGVNPVQLIAVGHGSDQPAMSYEGLDNKEEAREYNRRAEFAVVTNPSELFRMSQAL